MTHEKLGQEIDAHSKLNTTADTLKFLRRHNTDAYILDALEYCSIGNKQSLQQLINKKPVEYRQELERPELEYKDVLDNLKGE